jgi:hypothetical protein
MIIITKKKSLLDLKLFGGNDMSNIQNIVSTNILNWREQNILLPYMKVEISQPVINMNGPFKGQND